MYLIIAIVALVLGASSSEGDIWNVPLAQLTMHMIFGKLLAWVYYACALALGLKSLESDHIWPWRWTKAFMYSVIVRAAVAGIFVYGIIQFVVSRQMDFGWELITIVVTCGILLYFVLFSPKFEFFEKEEKHLPVEELAESVVLVEPWFPSEEHEPKKGEDDSVHPPS